MSVPLSAGFSAPQLSVRALTVLSLRLRFNHIIAAHRRLVKPFFIQGMRRRRMALPVLQAEYLDAGVCNCNCSGSFHHRDGAPNDAGVMPPMDGNGGFLHGAKIHRMLFL